MRCLRPVSRLKTVLLPELGLPTTAMLATGCRLTEMSDSGIRVSVALVTRLLRRDGKAACLLLAERDATTEQAEFHRVTAQRTAGQFDLGALDEPQHHQALDLRVADIDCSNDPFLAPFHGCECFTVTVHSVPAFTVSEASI